MPLPHPPLATSYTSHTIQPIDINDTTIWPNWDGTQPKQAGGPASFVVHETFFNRFFPLFLFASHSGSHALSFLFTLRSLLHS